MRTSIQFRKGLTSLGGQVELMLSAVRGQRFAADQAVIVEFLDDAAEIAGVEIEFYPDLLGCRAIPVRKFVQHPRFAQRERAFEKPLPEHAKLAGVKAIEGANRRYSHLFV